MSADELDVDAELLALAGDDSDEDDDASGSDAGEIAEQTEPDELNGPRTPSEEPKPSVEKETSVAGIAADEQQQPPPSVRRGVAQKVRKSRKRRERRRELEDDLADLEDGSPSPSPERAMSDSDADAPASPDASADEGPLYPVEGRFMSESDRKQIMSLPEIEREEILAERAAEILKRQQDVALQKALATSEAQQKSKAKRKASTADLDDTGSKRARAKTGRTALDDYRKARQAKGAERTSRLDAGRDRGPRSRSASSASDRDADGESEVEWAEPSSSTRRDADEPLAELKDFDRCRIGRSAFAKIHFYPNFEQTMTGCFTRVSIGMNRETGQNMYRMAQIKGFQQGKPYTLEGANGKTFHTDLYALVSQGSNSKPWPFAACSDSAFTDAEFARYKDTLEKERLRLPRKAWLIQKLDDIHAFLNVNWTDLVLKGKFDRQKEMERRVDPAKIAAAKRQEILKRKVEAEETQDEEEIARCEAELIALDNSNASSGGPSISISGPTNGSINNTLKSANSSSPLKQPLPAATKALTQQEHLAQVNARNRAKNADDVRRALLAERKKLQLERGKAAEAARAKKAADEEKRAAAAAAALAVPGDMTDLFGSDVSRAGTPMSGVSTPRMRRSRAGTPAAGVPGGVKKEKSGLGLLMGALGKAAKEREDKEDELGGMDLGIDVEI